MNRKLLRYRYKARYWSLSGCTKALQNKRFLTHNRRINGLVQIALFICFILLFANSKKGKRFICVKARYDPRPTQTVTLR
nr:MAG TPA: hypothetical protein [Caudoviricetes sp.]